jgi:hypothetical protein
MRLTIRDFPEGSRSVEGGAEQFDICAAIVSGWAGLGCLRQLLFNQIVNGAKIAIQ